MRHERRALEYHGTTVKYTYTIYDYVLYMCIYIYIHIHIYTYTHIYVYIYIHKIYIYINIYIYILIFICTSRCAHTQRVVHAFLAGSQQGHHKGVGNESDAPVG